MTSDAENARVGRYGNTCVIRQRASGVLAPFDKLGHEKKAFFPERQENSKRRGGFFFGLASLINLVLSHAGEEVKMHNTAQSRLSSGRGRPFTLRR